MDLALLYRDVFLDCIYLYFSAAWDFVLPLSLCSHPEKYLLSNQPTQVGSQPAHNGNVRKEV